MQQVKLIMLIFGPVASKVVWQLSFDNLTSFNKQ